MHCRLIALIAAVSGTPLIAHADVYTAYPAADTYNIVFTPAAGTATQMSVSGQNEYSITNGGVLATYYWYNVVETSTAGASAPLIYYLDVENPAVSQNHDTLNFNFGDYNSAYTGGNFINLSKPNQPLIAGTYNLIYDSMDSSGTLPTGNATLTITDLTAVPEPSSFVLLGLGIVGVAGAAWRREIGAISK